MSTPEERVLQRQREQRRPSQGGTGALPFFFRSGTGALTAAEKERRRTEPPGLSDLIDRTLRSHPLGPKPQSVDDLRARLLAARNTRAGAGIPAGTDSISADGFEGPRPTPTPASAEPPPRELTLDEREEQIRRAAGETNPVGSGALRDFEASFVGPRAGGTAPNRIERFATGRGQFGEPVFNNESIRRMNNAAAVQPETLRGGFGIAQPTPTALTDQDIAQQRDAGFITEKEATERRARLAQADANLRTLATTQARGAGQGGSRPPPRIFAETEDGTPVVQDLSPEEQLEAVKPFTDGVIADLARDDVPGFADDLAAGKVTTEGMASQMAAFNKRFTAEAKQTGSFSGISSEVELRDLFALGQALSYATGGSLATNLSPAEVLNTAEQLLANEEGRFFRSSGSNANGVKVSMGDLPGSVGRILERLSGSIREAALKDPNSPERRKIAENSAQSRVDDLRDNDVGEFRSSIRENAVRSGADVVSRVTPDFLERPLDALFQRGFGTDGGFAETSVRNFTNLPNPLFSLSTALGAPDSAATQRAREDLRKLRRGE